MKAKGRKTSILVAALMAALLAGTAAAAPERDNPVSGRTGTELTESGLTAAMSGRMEDAEDDLSAALRANPDDAKAAEGLMLVRINRGDKEAAAEAAALLVRSGSPRQAVAAANLLEETGLSAIQALSGRRDARDSAMVAEWIASTHLSKGSWAEARRAALSAIPSHPGSWRLKLAYATSLGMLDKAASARAALSDAETAGAPSEALSRVRRVVESAEARSSIATAEEKKAAKSDSPFSFLKQEKAVEAPADEVRFQPLPKPRKNPLQDLDKPFEKAEPLPAPAPRIQEPEARPVQQVAPKAAPKKAEPIPAAKAVPGDRFRGGKDEADGDQLF